jgi:hypothetical protein
MLRKLILDDIAAVHRGQTPRALACAANHGGTVRIDSFTGLRAKGLM